MTKENCIIGEEEVTKQHNCVLCYTKQHLSLNTHIIGTGDIKASQPRLLPRHHLRQRSEQDSLIAAGSRSHDSDGSSPVRLDDDLDDVLTPRVVGLDVGFRCAGEFSVVWRDFSGG